MTARLNRGLTRRLHDERRARYRQRLYAFPRRVAALKTAVLAQVEQLVGAVPGTAHLFLRGVYITSSGADGSGRGWFVDALARDVLLPEKALFRRGRWHLKW
jgi:type VI protein secretion system component VasK